MSDVLKFRYIKNIQNNKRKNIGRFYAICTKKCPFFLLIILTIVLLNDILTKNSNKWCQVLHIFTIIQ